MNMSSSPCQAPSAVAAPHPFVRPPSVGHEPHNPVRDETKLAPTEDIDREPDGVPQERKHGLAGFAARLGDRAIVERVLAAIDPADPIGWRNLQELA